ncbi:MAG: MOSC domain-containing protein [Thermoanaerobacteraceae bacterium]|nr:MOSC domain-containing protein [Thermoanaerobacteraceae bacterium]
MGKIIAVCKSENKGERKVNVGSVRLVENFGVKGDAHGGNWHRQVSLLAMESIAKMIEKGLKVGPGDFAENITTEGIDLVSLPVGTKLRAGKTLLEVTQIGKKCHAKCAIYEQAGDCIMPREGIFTKVLKGGVIFAGDSIDVVM